MQINCKRSEVGFKYCLLLPNGWIAVSGLDDSLSSRGLIRELVRSYEYLPVRRETFDLIKKKISFKNIKQTNTNKMKIILAFGLLVSILSTTNAVKDGARDDGEVR